MSVSGNAWADSDPMYPGVSFALGPYRSSMFRDFFVDHMAAHTILTVGRLGGHDSRNRSGLKIPSTQFLNPLQSLVLREILPLALSSRRTLTPGGGAIPGSQPLPRGMAGSRARAAPPRDWDLCLLLGYRSGIVQGIVPGGDKFGGGEAPGRYGMLKKGIVPVWAPYRSCGSAAIRAIEQHFIIISGSMDIWMRSYREREPI